MYIADNIIKYYLKNVLFFCGTACGGKTTISNKLAAKYNLTVYCQDDHYPEYKQIADAFNQPATAMEFTDWETYFNRPYVEYHAWLQACTVEQAPMVLLALAMAAQNGKVVADVHLPLKILYKVAEPEQVVFLVQEPGKIALEYYRRDDHKALRECIMKLPRPEASMANCSRTLTYGARLFLAELDSDTWYVINRSDGYSIAETLALVEEHFQLC